MVTLLAEQVVCPDLAFTFAGPLLSDSHMDLWTY